MPPKCCGKRRPPHPGRSGQRHLQQRGRAFQPCRGTVTRGSPGRDVRQAGRWSVVVAAEPEEHPFVRSHPRYLMHRNKPVLGGGHHPVRLCEGLWDRATRGAQERHSLPKGSLGPPFQPRVLVDHRCPVWSVPYASLYPDVEGRSTALHVYGAEQGLASGAAQPTRTPHQCSPS